MNTEKFHLKEINAFLDAHTIATFDQLKTAFGNPSRATLFRKTKQLKCLTSYSHRGKFYTLSTAARFNTLGLWSYQSVWFSRFGNLLQTAKALADLSDFGYSSNELTDILHVKTKHALIQLVRDKQLQRKKIGTAYIYMSAENKIARRQEKNRLSRLKNASASVIVKNPDLAAEEAKAMIVLFCSMLNERQRRLYAGLESLKLGYGGDSYIASLLNMNPHTVARGRKELIDGDLELKTVRTPGGGRLLQEKKHLK